jgi:hypothetical protein
MVDRCARWSGERGRKGRGLGVASAWSVLESRGALAAVDTRGRGRARWESSVRGARADSLWIESARDSEHRPAHFLQTGRTEGKAEMFIFNVNFSRGAQSNPQYEAVAPAKIGRQSYRPFDA